MPEKFGYPTKGWSTGNMRMAKREMKGPSGKEFQELEGIRKEKTERLSQAGGQYPQMSPEDWDAWQNLPTKPGNVYAPKNYKDLGKMLETNPDGFTVNGNNPNIKDIEGNADIFTIPDGDGNLFVKPRKQDPMISQNPPIGAA